MSRNSVRLLLALILMSAAGVRLYHLNWGLNSSRFYDEGFSLDNVRPIVFGRFQLVSTYYPSPVFNLPPAVALMASRALHDWTGVDWLPGIDNQGNVTRTGYFICRIVTATYGLIAVLLTFVLGRQVFSPAVGLLGALLFAFQPWAIRTSSYFNPDSQLEAFTMLVLCLTVAAWNRPTWRRYVGLGVAVALAMSPKMTGVTTVAPLVAVTALFGLRDWSRIRLAALAGVSSVVAFFTLNPNGLKYLIYLRYLSEDYAQRAWTEGMTRAQVPGRVVEQIAGEFGYGPWLASLAGITAIVLAVRIPRTYQPSRAHVTMLVVFPVVFVAFYANRSPYFKGNNFAPLFPFISLFLARGLEAIWHRLGQAWSPLKTQWGTLVAIVGATALAVPSGWLFVYRSLTPTTQDVAQDVLEARLAPDFGQLAFFETWSEPPALWEGRDAFHQGNSRMELVDRLSDLDPERVAMASGLVFERARLDGPDPFYRGLLEGPDSPPWELVEPHWFRSRGEPLIVTYSRLTLLEEPVQVEMAMCDGEPCYQGSLPASLISGTPVNVHAWLSYDILNALRGIPELRLGSRVIPLLWVNDTGGGHLFVTERVRLEPNPPVVRLMTGPGTKEPGPVIVTLLVWKQAP